MIIQCEQCRTKFKLDDERVSDRGVRVRCARCRHVFKVTRPEAAVEAASPSTTPETFESAFATSGQADVTPMQPAVTTENAFDFSLETPAGADFGELPEQVSDIEVTSAVTSAINEDLAALHEKEQPAGFDFGEIPEPADTDATVIMTAASATTVAAPSAFAEEPSVDFNFGDIPEVTHTPEPAAQQPDTEFAFGEVSHEAIAKETSFGPVTDEAAQPQHQPDTFDFGDVSFADVTTSGATDTGEPSAWGDETVVMAPPKPQEPAPEQGFDFGVADELPQQEPAAASFDFGTIVPQATEETPEKEISFDFGEAIAPPPPQHAQAFDFTARPSETIVAAPATSEDVDFGSFDFDHVSVAKPDDSFAFDPVAVAPEPAASSKPAAQTAEGDFAFAFDDVQTAQPAPSAASDDFGFAFDDAQPQQPLAATGAAGLSFSFDDAASKQESHPEQVGFDMSSVDFGSIDGAAAPMAAPAAPVSDFSLGEIDFGADTAAPVAVHEDTVEKGSAALSAIMEMPSAASVPPPDTAAQQFSFEPVAQHHEEAPPLPISSRRRQSPAITAIIGAVVVVVLAVLGYMGFQMFADKPAPAEDGRITVQKVNAYFLPASTAGELLVINGELVNNFKKARASLQVKATLYAQGNNAPIISKTAFAGNQLTREQLATMTAEKIEATMNNQFGDSLTNLEVQPGKPIPFTLVIVNPPSSARDYGVEALGSTVAATGK